MKETKVSSIHVANRVANSGNTAFTNAYTMYLSYGIMLYKLAPQLTLGE